MMPSPYACQMGASIAALVRVFEGKVPDAETNARTLELATDPEQWSNGHALFDVVRRRFLKAKDEVRLGQYTFEEACLKSLYNESGADDPFDSVSPYWIVPNAIGLAELLGIPIEAVLDAMSPTTW